MNINEKSEDIVNFVSDAEFLLNCRQAVKSPSLGSRYRLASHDEN
jgi:hypothetical protein